MPVKESILATIQTSTNLIVTPTMIEMLEAYIKLLLEHNKRINLTAIIEEDEIWRKHVLDSLLIFSFIDIIPAANLIDVGTGAGIPGLVLKIFRPDIRLTMLEATKKKVNFLEHAVAQLCLTGVESIWGRAEEICHHASYRERFDIAVARGVARLNILVEYCLPFVKVDGLMVAYKGPEGEAELKEAGKAIALLGGKETGIWSRQLADETLNRSLIVITKAKATPHKYPRRTGAVAKRPII